MDLISILATVILITTIGTLIVAVAAYAAFKLRDKRRPKRKEAAAAEDGPYTPIFLERYTRPNSAAPAAGRIEQP